MKAPSDIAQAQERAALAIGRLDGTLDGHPLLPAWQHWVRLEAVRRHAAADGFHIGTQRLAAMIEGLRLRPLGTPYTHERGADIDALNHALGLYGHMIAAADERPEDLLDETTGAVERRRAVAEAVERLVRPSPHGRIAGIGTAMREWIGEDRPRGPVRAAVPVALRAGGLCRTLMPILAGSDTLHPEADSARPAGWDRAFAHSLEREAEEGREILRRLEWEWRRARTLIGTRRRNSRLPGVVDLLAATPLIGPARLAALLGCSVRGAALMLEELVACGAGAEVTGRGSHRLYGLAGHAGIRDETAGPRRYGSRRGRPPKVPVPEAEIPPPSAALPPAVPARLERLEIDGAALDALLADTSRIIERVQARLKGI